jgi:hypothetical protein
MAIGGFSGSDPVPTLGQFQDDVAQHRVTYYIAADNRDDPGPGRGFGSQPHSDIAAWVAAHFNPIKVGSDTVYDLTPGTAV